MDSEYLLFLVHKGMSLEEYQTLSASEKAWLIKSFENRYKDVQPAIGSAPHILLSLFCKIIILSLL